MTIAARPPYHFARARQVVLEDGPDGATCLYQKTTQPDALLEIQRIAGAGVTYQVVEADAFEDALSRIYRDSATEAATAAGGGDDELTSLAESAAEIDDLLDQRDDAPVIRLINALLLEAIREEASDIHIEVGEKRLVVRFRIDGVLRDRLEPPRNLSAALVSRIKIMARLDISEKRLPQDGRVSLRIGGHEVDVRVSTIPSQHGERVVMRLLDKQAGRLSLAAVGMSERDHKVFGDMLRRPNGVVLVTGATGSGKTTTLYAALGAMDQRKQNIMTVEDPIEYSMPGVAQTQVDARTDLTFARGLRAILRQDPDVIMVGEIRDAETASVAVQAAMTGHFVLSTLHTNSAVGAVTRLIDMGVERFLLAPMLTGMVAQRLVRTLCPDCRAPHEATADEAALMDGALEPGAQIFRAVGCEACNGLGYRGRTGIYEVVAVSDRMQAMIHSGAAEAELVAAARADGPSLLADGARKVREGATTIEEVARVVQDA